LDASIANGFCWPDLGTGYYVRDYPLRHYAVSHGKLLDFSQIFVPGTKFLL